MGMIPMTDEDRKRWRQHQLEFLRNYPEFGRFNGEEKYTKIEGSRADTPRWAADEIERLEGELAKLQARRAEETTTSQIVVSKDFLKDMEHTFLHIKDVCDGIEMSPDFSATIAVVTKRIRNLLGPI